MNDFVVFVDHAIPKANTTNIHKTSCGHYHKYLRNGSEGTFWEETPDIPSSKSLANRFFRQYQTLGVHFAGCCMKEFNSENPIL